MTGNLEEFKSYINGTKSGKPVSIFEDVSASGYKWTAFHYAMQYGKWEIIKYIIEYIIDLDLLDETFKMKTSDNKYLCYVY